MKCLIFERLGKGTHVPFKCLSFFLKLYLQYVHLRFAKLQLKQGLQHTDQAQPDLYSFMDVLLTLSSSHPSFLLWSQLGLLLGLNNAHSHPLPTSNINDQFSDRFWWSAQMYTSFFYSTHLVGSPEFNIIPLFLVFEGTGFVLNTIAKYKRIA